MSEVASNVYIQRLKEGDGLEVYAGIASIPITELHIRPMSNTATPHELLGRGGARLALTDTQLVQLVAEYLRFRLQEHTDVRRRQVHYDFYCLFTPEAL